MTKCLVDIPSVAEFLTRLAGGHYARVPKAVRDEADSLLSEIEQNRLRLLQYRELYASESDSDILARGYKE